MRRTVGIDISGSSIKVAELNNSGKGVELVSFFNGRLKEGQFSEELVDVLREKIGRGAKTILAIPATFAILRSAVVPFTDVRKIREISRFEAEQYLPFPAEEVVVDFYVIKPEGEGKRIMLVAVRREFIEKHLSLLKKLGVEPEVIDLDSMGLLNLVDEERGTFALVDIGSDTTLISIVSGGVPLLLGVVPKGGNNLTEALATAEEMSRDEAEKKKTEQGLTISENMEVEPCAFRETLASIVNEISYTINAFSLQGSGSEIGKIVLSGGGAGLKNLPEFLKGKLGMDVEQIDGLRGISHNLDENSVSGIRGCGDVAIGLALRGLECRKTEVALNLRKGLVETPVGRRSFIQQVSLISVIVLLCFSIVFIRFHRRWAYLSNVEGQIQKTVAETFPGERFGERSSLEIISILRRRVGESGKRYSDQGGFSTLELLRALSLSIPSSIGVEVTNMRLNEDLIQLEGETNSFETVEKLLKQLSSSGYFREVRVNKADSLHGKVRFRLNIYPGKVTRVKAWGS